MIIECSPEDGLRLTEPFDFRSFKLVLKGEAGNDAQSMKGITLVNAGNALVPIDLVLTLPGRPADATWERGYGEMIANASKYGWIDSNANAIRAHVEREC